MKRLIINLVAILIIFAGGAFLTIPQGANAAVVSPQQQYMQLDTCGECSTDDPDKCCKKTWFGCKTYVCKEKQLK
jgi:hypothetical protein